MDGERIATLIQSHWKTKSGEQEYLLTVVAMAQQSFHFSLQGENDQGSRIHHAGVGQFIISTTANFHVSKVNESLTQLMTRIFSPIRVDW